jgi:adenylate kinase family enzyme
MYINIMKKVIFIMGPTNVGKTYFISEMQKSFNIYPVMIGKILRAKYPPDYFDGQAAPAKTDNEAWNIMIEEIKKAHDQGMTPLVDGQPRNQQQLDWVFEKLSKELFGAECPLGYCSAIHLWAPREERVKRAQARDIDPKALELSMQRMDGDVFTLYDLWLQIEKSEIETTVLSSSDFNEAAKFISIVGN